MIHEHPPYHTGDWAKRISRNSEFLNGISRSDLGDLRARVRDEKREAEIFCGLANPPLDPQRNHGGWQDADFVERAVVDELNRRNVMQPEETPQPAKKAPSTKPAVSEPLPTLEDVVKDAGKFLPKLWAALAEERPPAFDIEGNFILERKRGEHAALYALAAALCTGTKLLKEAKPGTVYLILCARFERKPAERPDKIQSGKRDYSSFFDRFLNVVRTC